MFVLQDSYRYWWPVKVVLPDPENPGQILEKGFEMLFEAPEKASAEAFDREVDAQFEARKEAGETTIGAFDREIEVLVRYCHDWRDVVRPDGSAVPFSPDALRGALGHAAIAAAVSRAWRGSIESGGARLGN